MSSKQRPALSARGTVIHASCTALHWQRVHAETRGYWRTGPGARVCGKVAGVAAPGDAAIAWHQAHIIRHLHATQQALQLGYRVLGCGAWYQAHTIRHLPTLHRQLDKGIGLQAWRLAPGAHHQAPANHTQAPGLARWQHHIRQARTAAPAQNRADGPHLQRVPDAHTSLPGLPVAR